MNILVAHPSESYLDVLNQMISSREMRVNLEHSSSFENMLLRTRKNKYDLLIIDSEIMNGDKSLLIEQLEDICLNHSIICTIRENEKQLARDLYYVGVKNCVIKKKGYLSAIPEYIKKTLEQTQAQNTRDEVSMVGHEKPDSAEVYSGGYFVCDRKGRFLSVNQYIQSLFHYSQEELLQLYFSDLVPEDKKDEFVTCIFQAAETDKVARFIQEVMDKVGRRYRIEIAVKALKDEAHGDLLGFKGRLRPVSDKQKAELASYSIDQNRMIADLINVIKLSYSEPMHVVLRRVAEIASQVFRFNHSAIALLDKRKDTYTRHAVVGFSMNGDKNEEAEKSVDIPKDVVDKIFGNGFKVQVIPHQNSSGTTLLSLPASRYPQERRWNPKDVVLVNLFGNSQKTFGYILLEEPEHNQVPDSSLGHHLELFGRMVSMIIENSYHFSSLERKNRRLKQVMVNSNIFKLYHHLNELLKEVVWSVKFTLDFNVVSLILLSRKSGMLETKAVACEDKIKCTQLAELTFNLKEYSDLMRDQYRRSRSYLITQEEVIFKHFKQIYYNSVKNDYYQGSWPRWAILLVPIKSREGKIIGFLMVDDPADGRMVTTETIHTLEIMANQIAIAIDNRVMYIQAKEGVQTGQPVSTPPKPIDSTDDTHRDETPDAENEYSGGGFKKLVERFLK
ncbi:PAS domain S-box protein [candidate division KSB1 bacterium]|nr:PAS domain S-box protein [candidate division KSB1 bacterium]